MKKYTRPMTDLPTTLTTLTIGAHEKIKDYSGALLRASRHASTHVGREGCHRRGAPSADAARLARDGANAR